VEAYETFDPAKPFASRQLVHNLNRVWSDELLGGADDSPELRRARELRPVVAAADHILDLHSTSEDVEPFWVYPAYERNAEVALATGLPSVHLVMPNGLGSGTPVIQHGRHGQAGGDAGAALVAECGQHFKRATGELAVEVTLGFLAHFGLVAPRPRSTAPQRRYELLRTYVIQTPDYRFARPVKGFETFAAGELIATDGDVEIRAPEDCTILMPAREPIVGKEGVYIARALPA
ncbi:MAG: succinylglutamate desuccinylase, partial [Comamonadaceae bacterium]